METYKCLDCGLTWEIAPTWEKQVCSNCGEHLNVTETTDVAGVYDERVGFVSYQEIEETVNEIYKK